MKKVDEVEWSTVSVPYTLTGTATTLSKKELNALRNIKDAVGMDVGRFVAMSLKKQIRHVLKDDADQIDLFSRPSRTRHVLKKK